MHLKMSIKCRPFCSNPYVLSSRPFCSNPYVLSNEQTIHPNTMDDLQQSKYFIIANDIKNQ